MFHIYGGSLWLVDGDLIINFSSSNAIEKVLDNQELSSMLENSRCEVLFDLKKSQLVECEKEAIMMGENTYESLSVLLKMAKLNDKEMIIEPNAFGLLFFIYFYFFFIF